MQKTFIAIVLFILAALLVLPLIGTNRSAAANPPPIHFAPSQAPGHELPGTQPPFDLTPITPVESAGAPLHEQI